MLPEFRPWQTSCPAMRRAALPASARRGTLSPEIIDRLNKEINAGLGDARIKTRIVELGGTVVGGSPAGFATTISEAAEKWAKVIKFAGIKAE